MIHHTLKVKEINKIIVIYFLNKNQTVLSMSLFRKEVGAWCLCYLHVGKRFIESPSLHKPNNFYYFPQNTSPDLTITKLISFVFIWRYRQALIFYNREEFATDRNGGGEHCVGW